MCDAGTAVQVHGGGRGLCVVLTVSYEKDLINFNDFTVATMQQNWMPIPSTILFKFACIIYSHNHWSA